MSVGISNTQYATRRKKLFDFLARVRAIGCVHIPSLPVACHISALQCRCRCRHSRHRCHRLAERRKILPHRGYIRDHTSTCQRHMHSVIRSHTPGITCLTEKNTGAQQSASSNNQMLHGNAKSLCVSAPVLTATLTRSHLGRPSPTGWKSLNASEELRERY
jgi:hypothetical protein